MSWVRDTVAAMSGYVPGEQPRDRRFVKLNTNENPYPPSPQVAAALRQFDPERLRRYPDPMAQPVREAAAALFGVTPDWILCGNGSDDLLTIAVRTCVDQGGCVAFPEPSYSLYPVLTTLQGARAAAVPLTDTWQLPDDAGARAAAAGARLFFLARPNAPTGTALAHERVRELCRQFPGLVWIDEAYADFAEDHCLDLVRECPNAVVSRTLSKGYSLAGLRLGLAVAGPDRIREMLKVKDSYNVSMLTQVLAVAALGDQARMLANVAQVRATRERVTARLTQLGFQVLPSQANFLFAAPPAPAAALFAALRDDGVLVRYFPGPRTGSFLRITIGTDADMDAFLAAVESRLPDAATAADTPPNAED